MELIQIVIVVIALFALSRVIIHMRKGKMQPTEYFMWVSLWIAVIAVSLMPSISTSISQSVGIQRGVDLLIYLSIIILFYLVYKIFVKLERINEDISNLTRYMALEKKKKR